MALSLTAAQRDTLRNAIATGVRTVNYGDKTVTYQNLDQMVAVLSAADAEAAGSASGRSTFAGFSNG